MNRESFAEKKYSFSAPVRYPINGKAPMEVTHGLSRGLPHNLWSLNIYTNEGMNGCKILLI